MRTKLLGIVEETRQVVEQVPGSGISAIDDFKVVVCFLFLFLLRVVCFFFPSLCVFVPEGERRRCVRVKEREKEDGGARNDRVCSSRL